MNTAFDSAKHEYTIDGRAVPSVTQILVECGIIDSQWYTDEGRIRGTYVAEATALYDRGELDDAALDPALQPYVAAWARFLLDSQFEIKMIERELFDAFGRYAGTLDRAGYLHKRDCVIEIKTGASESWHGLQLAGYAELRKCTTLKRLAVYLGDDGKYSCREFSDRNDFAVFNAALNVVVWKRNQK